MNAIEYLKNKLEKDEKKQEEKEKNAKIGKTLKKVAIVGAITTALVAGAPSVIAGDNVSEEESILPPDAPHPTPTPVEFEEKTSDEILPPDAPHPTPTPRNDLSSNNTSKSDTPQPDTPHPTPTQDFEM